MFLQYGTILGVIFIAELAGAIAVIVLRGKVSFVVICIV